jgi:hypothetical protein
VHGLIFAFDPKRSATLEVTMKVRCSSSTQVTGEASIRLPVPTAPRLLRVDIPATQDRLEISLSARSVDIYPAYHSGVSVSHLQFN